MTSQRLDQPLAVRDVNDGTGRIPFRVHVAVTGHRFFEDDDAVEMLVVERLAQVRRMFPATEVTPVVFTVLTALAEGADRLVPRLAPDALNGAIVELEVVLPLGIEEYLDDFETDASRREFGAMLDAAAAWTAPAQTEKLSGSSRDDAYQRAGRRIVDRADVVLAVWDGLDARGIGGTAEIVDYARELGVPLLIVPATRPGKAPAAADLGLTEPVSAPRFKLSTEAFQRLDEYNRIALLGERSREALQSSYQRIARAADGLAIRDQARLAADWAVPHYVRADVLALHHQARYTHLGRAIHFLAAFAVTAVAAQIVFARHTSAWLGFEIAFLLLLIAAVHVGRRGRVRERWIGYRSLAEAFRSALFLAMARVPDREETAGDVVKPWFQRAFSEAWRARPEIVLAERDAPDLWRFLSAAWIDDQITFHDKAAEQHRTLRARYTWIVYVLAGITVTVATLHIADLPRGGSWSDVFTFLAIILPGFGAAVTGLREHGQHRLHEERSRRTAARLRRLKERRQPPRDLASVAALAAETQRVLATENLDWSSVLEFQDLELVI